MEQHTYNIHLPSLIVVLGPTASGKSGLGIALAQQFNGEIVSADSRQVYHGLDIGTAKVTAEEQTLVPHHLLDLVEPHEVYTVSRFQQDAFAAIDDIVTRGKRPFLVGGSPHYIQAVVDGLDIPQVAPQSELRAALEARTTEDLLQELRERDPQSYEAIDRNNRRRIIRALEVCIVTGEPFSQQRRVTEPRYRSLLLGIQWPRSLLYERIDRRVDERMKQGMVQEVRDLLEAGISHERLDAFGLEYRFIDRYLRGEYESEAQMVERLKYAIHDFTRRQLSWFRRDSRIHWIEGGPEMEQRAEALIENFLENT
ncbi:MAG TPA: tRNA (adenosine(37)-N6)-dimethylallyltransferase MiaA [Ktedonobacter sp.]|nr:tRNA (adenosine(37)-N6)-dimethylallyltransferase MiaA [Ktedonobacter sp.]